MREFRIKKHPILSIRERASIPFTWQGQPLLASEGETIAAALYANGIHVFGHHHKDGAPQGIFCANGQCAQCMVIADGLPLKACTELVRAGMCVEPADGLARLPDVTQGPRFQPLVEREVPALIIGGGPAGLSAALELGKAGVQVLLVDDKQTLGGKLVLQTHRFFGSKDAVYAGTRGVNIAARLEKELAQYPNIEVWRHATALAVFKDQKVGILKDDREYVLVKPQTLLTATGARERFLPFRGNTLPGVYGAGAFQTLVNRDLVRPAEKLFIIGGGNVGLIAGYHALQAGIEVVGLVEALPECGGYRVHRNKLARLGVPILTSHTILSANGTDRVESVTIAQVDERFQPLPGTEKTYACDSVLIAVGLEAVDEFYHKACQFGMTAFAAGDAEEIAEASAAIFSGKIKGREIARTLGCDVEDTPAEWVRTGEILKSRPGPVIPEKDVADQARKMAVMPVFHCTQEIPCNPCSTVCPRDLIQIDANDIRKMPEFFSKNGGCMACEKCLSVCPGLAITLVDYRYHEDEPIVAIPFEFENDQIKERKNVTVLDTQGNVLADLPVTRVERVASRDHTLIVKVKAPPEIATRIAGIRPPGFEEAPALEPVMESLEDDLVICRCERVTAGEIRQLIRQGYRDLNEIKAVTRAGMGSCGSKTCHALLLRLFREEGIPVNEVADSTRRPVFVETPLKVLAGMAGAMEDGHVG